MTFSDYDTEAGPLLNILGWKPLSPAKNTKSDYGIEVVTRSSSKSKLKPNLNYLKTKFQEREATYTLRDSENKLTVPFPRTNYYKNSLTAFLETSSVINIVYICSV